MVHAKSNVRSPQWWQDGADLSLMSPFRYYTSLISLSLRGLWICKIFLMLGTLDFPNRCTPCTLLQIKCSGVTFRCTFFYIESGACVLRFSTESNMADESYDWKLEKWFKVI